MNYGILSRNVIVKCLTLVMVMLFSYDGAAQKYTYNLGNNFKLYSYQGGTFWGANIISSKDDALTIAENIAIFGGGEILTLSSSYGNFVEFQLEANVKMNSTPSYYINILTPCIRHDENGYCLVKNGSNLYLVKVFIAPIVTDGNVVVGVTLNEEMIGIVPIDLSDIGDDFKIILKDQDFGYLSLYILNNGVLYAYDEKDIKKPSSVSSPKADVDDSKTYSIDGMQVDTPHNGIFIKGNKKAFVK